MTSNSRQLEWLETNHAILTAQLDRLRVRLERAIESVPQADQQAEGVGIGSSAIESLVALFGLTDFERDLLLLCAGVELDSRIAHLCSQLTGRPAVTLQVACGVLSGAHWTAILPNAPLREWLLIEIDDARNGRPLVDRGLRISERVLHHLTGIAYLDDALRPLVRECAVSSALLPSLDAQAHRLSTHLGDPSSRIVLLTGTDAATRSQVAAAACRHVGAKLFQMDGGDVRNDPDQRDLFLRLWEREAKLSPVVLMIETESSASPAIIALAQNLAVDVIISSREPRLSSTSATRGIVRIDLPKPALSERCAWWETSLGDAKERLNGTVEALAAQFDIGPFDIDSAISSAGTLEPDGLWNACRIQARVALDDLAERIEASAQWDDIVLPGAQIATLRQINAHMRQRLTVYEKWGFGSPGARGLGMSALFAGPSGTGKTMAAEVLATELQLDLFRIDLSQVVSKYVGETEKNLRRVFEAAEHGGVILLFDEADALFGKRSEVKDSHDRYANIEVSYLLQQMEAYRGLAILTTNQRSALDTAFLRRLRFIVDFPFPDASMRAEIWRRIFPSATPTTQLVPAQLARLSVPGGNIRNIALNAAFLAADAGESVGMSHILSASRSEYAKLEKPLTEAETLDWIV